MVPGGEEDPKSDGKIASKRICERETSVPAQHCIV